MSICQLGVARTTLFTLCLIASSANRAITQELVVKRDANLRLAPTTTSGTIRHVLAGDTLTLVATAPEHGYVHVEPLGSDTEGWVYGRFVRLLDRETGPKQADAGGIGAVDQAPVRYHQCPLEGDPTRSGRNYREISALNALKNRYHAPAPRAIDSSVTLGRLLQPGVDDARFDEGNGAIVQGVVDAVKVGGVETVNCKARDPAFRDTHIEISVRPHDPESERVIVEITPRWRSAMAAHGLDWSTNALRARLVGHLVRFRGWLLYDAEHQNEAENTSPGNPKDWRATVWEIHPVTSFEVLDSTR